MTAPVDEINTSSKRVKKREDLNMSDDLVKRLRYLAKDIEAYESKTMSEAADRIEQLEAALTHIWAFYPISVSNPRETIDAIRDFAFTALGEKKDD